MDFLSQQLNSDTMFFIWLALAAVGIFYLAYKKTKRGWNILPSSSGMTPTLDVFSRDLTVEARRNKIDPVIGCAEEIKRMIQILSRRTKNNVILVGEAGTGKTALAEGLAMAIANQKVPPEIQGKRVLALNLGGMLAGTQYRGEFEQRMKAITDEISVAGRSIILFIDEIQNLTQAGEATGAIGAANLLKPALARGDIQAIGACTVEDYYQYISRDTSLERRFQPVMVKEATAEETFKILQGIRSKYEDFHQVKISDEVLKAVVDLAVRYMPERYFPDKAIDLLDEASAKTRLEFIDTPGGQKEWPQVKPNDIESVIFQWGRDVMLLKKKVEMMKG